MATREWSQAEREKAAEEVIRYAYKKHGEDSEDMEPYIAKDIVHLLEGRRPVGGDVAIDLQCELNDLRAQIEEARELLERSAALNPFTDFGYANERDLWLDRNPETK